MKSIFNEKKNSVDEQKFREAFSLKELRPLYFLSDENYNLSKSENFKKARIILSELSKAGYVEAKNNLAVVHLLKQDNNYEGAAKLLIEAVKEGCDDAKYNLALALWHNNKNHQNNEVLNQIIALLEESVHEHPNSILALIYIYSAHNTIADNNEKRNAWIEVAKASYALDTSMYLRSLALIPYISPSSGCLCEFYEIKPRD